MASPRGRNRTTDPVKPCTAFQTSTCTLGAACPNPHVKDPKFRKKRCRFFTLGDCNKGDTCTYSHDAPCTAYQTSTCTLGAACPKPHVPDPKFRKQSCRFFALGKCSKGDLCTYSHDAAMIAAYVAGEEAREQRKEEKERRKLVGRMKGIEIGKGEGDARDGEDNEGAGEERVSLRTKDEQAEEQKDAVMADGFGKE